jgi:hypothetical protein
MRRGWLEQIVARQALVVTGCGLALLLVVSSASASPGQQADRVARGLISPNLIRAEIVTLNGNTVHDYRIYRGFISAIRGRLVTLSERDGTVARIKLSPIALIRMNGRTVAVQRVRPGMSATVMTNGSAPASWFYVAKRSPDPSGGAIKSLLSTGYVRIEVVSQVGGALLDNRVDTGVIASVGSNSLTLDESDGTVVQLPIDSTTQVQMNNRMSDLTVLAAGMSVTTIRSGAGPVNEIWASGKRAARIPRHRK